MVYVTVEVDSEPNQFPQKFRDGKMDRIKPEKVPRQKVQKIWRNVRWAESFPDESLSMEAVDLTQNFALRKIALLFETKKYGECASLLRRLKCVNLSSILKEVPVEVLHDTIPHSLPILEVLYKKLYETTGHAFPKKELCVDQFVKRIVAMFSKSDKSVKNCNIYYPSCRNILRVIGWIEPNLRQQIRQRKWALDKCLRHLGQHGLVGSSDGNLMNLHDALKLEFEKVVTSYHNALKKLDELNMSAKHPHSSSVTSGPAPSGASHQRLMQVSREDLQSRIIKNKTVYNIVEPAVTNQYLRKLIHILEKRIEYDKVVLFHDTELRKMCDGPMDESFISVSLRQFSQGYTLVLQLLREVADVEEGLTEEDEQDVGLTSDEDLLSPLTDVNWLKHSLPHLNGLVMGSGGSTSRLRNLRGRGFTGGRQSVITAPLTVPLDVGHSNGLSNGHATLVPHSLASMNTAAMPNHLPINDIEALENEVKRLQDELDKSQDFVMRLQEREKQLRERLGEQAYRQFTLNQDGQFEDVNLGSQRPTELIRQYGGLYSEGRVDTLDALDTMPQLAELEVLKGKILFSVIVLAFRSAQQALQVLRGKLRHLMNLPIPDSGMEDPVTKEMETHIGNYLAKAIERFDLSPCISEVCTQIYATLFDYPCLKDCAPLKLYVAECVRIAWGLTVQNPPYVILYDSQTFSPNLHTYFHTSDPNMQVIQGFLWPTLLEGHNGTCVHKGVVIT